MDMKETVVRGGEVENLNRKQVATLKSLFSGESASVLHQTHHQHNLERQRL